MEGDKRMIATQLFDTTPAYPNIENAYMCLLNGM